MRSSGEWVVNGFGGDFKTMAIVRGVVVSTRGMLGDPISDARLFASAPELLAALKVIAGMSSTTKLRRVALAAIAKVGPRCGAERENRELKHRELKHWPECQSPEAAAASALSSADRLLGEEK